MRVSTTRNGGLPPSRFAVRAATMAALSIRPSERSKTMRLRIPMLIAAAVAVAAALVAAGCGGGDKKGAAGGGGATKRQVLKMAWGAEPPSLDPGLATDTTSSNMLLNIMDPLVKLGARRSKPVPTWPKAGTATAEDRHVPSPRRRSLDERRPGDGERLRVLVEAHDLARARGRLRLPVLRDRRCARSTTSASRTGDALKDKVGIKALDTAHAASQADLGAAVVRAAGRAPLRSSRSTSRPSRSTATSGPRRRTSSPTGRSSSHGGSTTLDRPRQERRVA